MTNTHHLIDGASVPGEGQPIAIVDPSDGTEIGQFNEASPSQVAATVAAARRSFDSGVWSEAPRAQRQAFLRSVANAIRADAGELSALQVTEGGMPSTQVRGHIAAAAGWFDYYADFLSLEGGESHRQLGGATALVEREPIGVCALFSPWNVPVGLSALKLAPALAAGNSVVLKPSELTPLAVRRMVGLLHDAGLPDGVLNCVNGRGTVTGSVLADADDIDMISFTGGQAGGRAVATAAAKRSIPCVLELGGKSATIVFEDANLEDALKGAVTAAFGNNGQACLSGSRVLVQEEIAEEFIGRFKEAAEAIVVGDPRDPGTGMGALISAGHRDHVLGYYDAARTDGDEVLFGGLLEGQGYLVRPGAVHVQSNQSRVWREEIFGPIAAIATFSNEGEAVRKANDSEFGLSSYVWTSNIDRALSVARRLRTGTVMVNSAFMRELNAPFGGFRKSGVGREGGVHSWNNFTEAKAIVIRHGD